MDELLELMSRHRSIRAFADEPLDDHLLERCVRAAQMAATSSHVQAYALVRVRSAATRTRLAELAGGQPQVERAGALLVVCADSRRHALACAFRGEPYAANFEAFLVAVIDAALFAQNLALALEGQGLGTCFLGGLRNHLAEVDRLLELPERVFPLFGLCAGRPAEDPPPRPRLPLELVLCEERYPDDAAVLEGLARYDAEMARDWAARGKPGRDWSRGVARKLRAPARPGLAEFFEAKGARLEG